MHGLPYTVRRAWSRLVGLRPGLLRGSLGLFRGVCELLCCLPGGGRLERYRDYLRLLDTEQTSQFAQAVAALEGLQRFREGARFLGHRNATEAVLCRSGLFDPLFQRGDWPSTACSNRFQYPTIFLPGVPAQGLYESSQIPWAAVLEENYEEIQREVADLLQSQETDSQWGMLYLYLDSQPQLENLQRCPKTWALLESLPRADREHNGISTLTAGDRVPPHSGLINGSLRVILPLLTPEQSGLRVGDKEILWQPGEAVVFDDSYLHEAWNEGEQLRAILVLSTWHPDFNEEEIEAVRAVLRTSRQLGRSKIWKINTGARVQEQRRAHGG